MTVEERRRLIEKYRQGIDEVLGALSGMTPAQLTTRAIAGKWTAAEIVHHLADSEVQSAIRIRKLVVEKHPVIQGYDQDLWAEKLRYNDRPIEPSLALFRAARESTLQVLEQMSDEDWRHLGWHTEAGSYHAERWLEIYAEHAHGHAAQIRRLREAMAR